MPSDAWRRSLPPCDGRYRPELDATGMYLLAAYTRQSNNVTRTVHGAVFRERGLFKACALYRDLADAQAKCDRLNVRIG